jgi:FtsP/CotA-like multicopper oxidase with cupredoxin domain
MATDKMIYLGPKVVLAGSVYNGRMPGPYLRATQGDHIRITFINKSSISHSINFSALHPSNPPGKMPDMTFQSVP